MKRKRRGVVLIALAFICAVALAACDSGDNVANQAFNGTFRGTTSDGDTITTVLTVGSPLQGTFETGSGASGTIDGTAAGNEATFTATFSCQAGSSGQANGTATLTDNNTLSLTLSGTDCAGATVDVTGTLNREADAFGAANRVRGGLLYDKWWAVNGADEPADTNPNYPTDVNPAGRTGSQTWRCKECHGWDYKGKDGAYGEGSSHFTGIAGILETSTATTSSAGASLGAVRALSAQDLFDIIRNGKTGGATGDMTGYSTAQLSDTDVWDLVRFIKDGLIDVATYIDSTTKDAISPDTTNGMTKYDAVCAACHGVYGALLKFGGGDDEVIGDIADGNPWEFFHKVRFGQPGEAMPSGIENAWTSGDVRDVLGHAQTFSTFAELNSVKRGALLYDKWWAVNGATEPTDTNPTYPTDVNPAGRTGSQTWRCKECHGWDYQGKDGAYASGSSHFTGIAGILSASSGATTSAVHGLSGMTRGLTDQQLFDTIRNGVTGGATGDMTGYTQDQLSDADIWDLVMFIQLGLEQTGLAVLTNFIDLVTGTPINANVTNGQAKYDAVCAACHGADGKSIIFGSDEVIGDLADGNPWEFFHKASFGQPGSDPPMLGAIDQGWSHNDVLDILGYAQTLPLFSEGDGGGEPPPAPTGDAAAGLTKYDTTCAFCHSLGTHDTTTALGAPDLSGKGELVVNDLSTISASMAGITLTDQEVLDVAAALEAN